MKRDAKEPYRQRRPQRALRDKIRQRGSRRVTDDAGSAQAPALPETTLPAANQMQAVQPEGLDAGNCLPPCPQAADETQAQAPDDSSAAVAAQETAADTPPETPIGSATEPPLSADNSPAPSAPYIGVIGKKARPAPHKPKRSLLIRIALGAAGLAALLIAAALIMPPADTASGQEKTYARGWTVLLKDRPLGVVSDRNAAATLVDSILNESAALYGMEVNDEVGVSFEPALVEAQYMCPVEDLRGPLAQNIEVMVNAIGIYVNNRRAVTVASRQDAARVLMGVLAPYLTDIPEGKAWQEVGFVERITVRPEFVLPGSVLTVDDALSTLTMGTGVQDNWYTVQEGDSLARIAKEFGIDLEDLRNMNPSVADTDVIRPGDRLNVALPRSWINVRFVETLSGKETLPYETTTVKDDSMYVSQKKVTQKGVDGQRFVVSQIRYVNGVETDRIIIMESVLEEPVGEIVREGTQKMPAVREQALRGLLPLPLKAGSYVISSRFGMRTLNGETRMHKGLDMAASTGTPIYASASGTVVYAGWASGYGRVVYIDHGHGVQTRYGHCSELKVEKGDTVKRGERIALVGNTGVSTGPHCHFEVRVDGNAVNPLG
ncbi:MAG: peptidoglycan DD-metalloendopeptidase family protein [Clostridiales bacterium]|nr:peptidoglycan DD-metalloendopeptidase family protein [Clostridiales bacterium]